MKRLLAMLLPSPLGRGGAKRTRAQREPEGAGEGSSVVRSCVDFVPSPPTPLAMGEGSKTEPSLSLRGEWKKQLRRIRQVMAVVVIASALALSAAAFAIDPLPFKDNAQRDRFQHLTSELRCMVCQDESLLASNADFAKQLRRQIFDMMQQGKSDKEIKDWLVARYSTFILYDPPLAPSTIALWFGTPVILLAGGIVVVVLLRRRTRPAGTIAEDPGDDW